MQVPCNIWHNRLILQIEGYRVDFIALKIQIKTTHYIPGKFSSRGEKKKWEVWSAKAAATLHLDSPAAADQIEVTGPLNFLVVRAQQQMNLNFIQP